MKSYYRDQTWYIFLPDPVGWAWTSPSFKDLQHSEQEGVVPATLSNIGKKFAYMVTLKKQGQKKGFHIITTAKHAI